MDRRRGEGIWQDEQKKLENQNKSKIILNKLKCIVCGCEIPHGESIIKDGVYCKECWDKKMRSLPWSQKKRGTV